MDRLSSYATREADTLDHQTRKANEDEAVTRLLRNLAISNETKDQQPAGSADTSTAFENGSEPAATEAGQSVEYPGEEYATNGDAKTKTGIPEYVKLYDIFYEQVVDLIRTRTLSIQDTMALLVSLVNLALYAPLLPTPGSGFGISCFFCYNNTS